MKEKMSTFMAMDILGSCNLYWINLNVKYIKEHLKSLEKLFDKFEIEKDYDGTDAESIIIDYIFSLRLFINATENVNKQVNEYLKGRGNTNINKNRWDELKLKE